VRRLAADLTKQFGRGFGFSQLKMMRQFYQTFPDVHTAKPLILQSAVEKSGIGQSLIGQFSQRSSVKLSRAIEHLGNIARAFPLPWTHYVRLLRVRNLHAREFYVREALAGGWSVRQLGRTRELLERQVEQRRVARGKTRSVSETEDGLNR
jgi:hypothetical protein